MNFIVLSTSRGTTFQSVIEAMNDQSLTAEFIGLVTDTDERKCLEKARAAGLPNITVDSDPDNREEFDKALDQAIEDIGANDDTIIAEMGWMWIHTPWFIKKWKNKLVNVHPSLLPEYGGKGMYGHHVHDAVLAAGEEESGVTFHIIDEGVDTGEILLQKKCAVLPSDDAEELQDRVQLLEKQWYPALLEMIHTGEISLP